MGKKKKDKKKESTNKLKKVGERFMDMDSTFNKIGFIVSEFDIKKIYGEQIPLLEIWLENGLSQAFSNLVKTLQKQSIKLDKAFGKLNSTSMARSKRRVVTINLGDKIDGIPF